MSCLKEFFRKEKKRKFYLLNKASGLRYPNDIMDECRCDGMRYVKYIQVNRHDLDAFFYISEGKIFFTQR